jgi:hypothetical protein
MNVIYELKLMNWIQIWPEVQISRALFVTGTVHPPAAREP